MILFKKLFKCSSIGVEDIFGSKSVLNSVYENIVCKYNVGSVWCRLINLYQSSQSLNWVCIYISK